MIKSADSLSSVVQEIESQGLANPESESKFVACIMRTMPDSPSKKEKAVILASGLEQLLSRHHNDSKLIVATSVALGETSEYEIPDFVKKLGRFMRFLDAPVASHSIKNIKLASFVAVHPEIIQVKHIDSLTALGRLPEGTIARGEAKNEIRIGETTIDIQKADLKEINKAVKKAKSEAPSSPKRTSKERAVEVPPDSPGDEIPFEVDMESALEEGSAPIRPEQDNLPLELSEAERVLSKVLGRLSSDNSHSELSQALEEARKLLLLAMSNNAFAARTETGDAVTGGLH